MCIRDRRLIDAYQLEKTSFFVQQEVECKEIIGVYKARDEAVSHLTVVDKRNGGKSDALNAGINVCAGELFACIDVDCVLERDALLRMIKPVSYTHLFNSSISRTTIDVLVVEDNEMNQKVMQGFLMRYHIEPVIANNGLEAVAILARRTFDLILICLLYTSRCV